MVYFFTLLSEGGAVHTPVLQSYYVDVTPGLVCTSRVSPALVPA